MLINVKFKKMSFFFFLYILYSSATYPPTTLKSQNHKITLLVKLLIVSIKKCLASWQSTFFKQNFELFYRKSAHKKQKIDTFCSKINCLLAIHRAL